MSRSSDVVYDDGDGGDDYDVDNGGGDDDVDNGGDHDDVDNGGCDSDGFLTALTDEQMCTQSSITGLPNLLTRIIRILEVFKSDDRNIRIIIICNSK